METKVRLEGMFQNIDVSILNEHAKKNLALVTDISVYSSENTKQ